MKYKRLIAYILDMLIIYIISSLIFTIVFRNDYQKYTEATEDYFNKITNIAKETKDKNKMVDNVNEISYNYIKLGTTQTIFVITTEIIYFIFIQFFLNGQTLGKKLLKIKIVPLEGEKLEAGLFVLREIVLLVIPIRVVDLIALLTTGMNTYLKINNLTSNLNSIISILIIGTILFRQDERGIHDLISKTKVIRVEKERK